MRLILPIGLLLLVLCNDALALPYEASRLAVKSDYGPADLLGGLRFSLRLPSPNNGVNAKLGQPRPSDHNPETSADAQSNGDTENRTAIYDIAAHTVYLPSGEQLEAHSGRGPMLDNPRYADVKGRGPTPPNVYELTLRSGLFHGVLAIRLKPVTGSTMFGRDNFLAHTYMFGPNGQSFGCVSFKDYPKFLQAFLSGAVDRLLVVPHLESEPSITSTSEQVATNFAPQPNLTDRATLYASGAGNH